MKDFDSKLNAFFLSLNGRLQSFPNIVAETATEHFKERFIQKNWDGEAWKPYKNPKREPKKGSLMMRSNNLMMSVRPSLVTSSRVRINAGSAKVPYARTHNEGLRMRGVQYVRPHHNSNFMGKGKRVQIQGFSRKMDYMMPKRQFMGKSKALLALIEARAKNHLKTR
ncbi:Phage virion morphogenesis family protein [Pedobacter terrae]|uniref:Phage virion morphogenesis family protein n=1 Tax=Pedobacter terrae TaxID=405671 RepID=A0A1G7TC75_9SPHI|nr:phage virion morphogenesis protein [Pedobacter terrae]SDG32200.1 Phage virion morphogenesis family protein [Pedobacter terrae]